MTRGAVSFARDRGTARHRLDASQCISVFVGKLPDLKRLDQEVCFQTLLTCKRVGVVHHSELTTKNQEMNFPLRTKNHDSEHRNVEQRCEYGKEKHDTVLMCCVVCGVRRAACGVWHVVRGVRVRGCVGVGGGVGVCVCWCGCGRGCGAWMFFVFFLFIFLFLFLF